MEIFVKLCSIMVMDALVSSVLTSIASRSGLAGSCETRRTESSRLNQEREWALGVWQLSSQDGYCSSDMFRGSGSKATPT